MARTGPGAAKLLPVDASTDTPDSHPDLLSSLAGVYSLRDRHLRGGGHSCTGFVLASVPTYYSVHG